MTTKNFMEEYQDQQFHFCNKVDLHCLNDSVDFDLKSIVSLATEHDFRGIVVPLGKLEELSKTIDKNSTVKPIGIIDYPYGSSSTYVRGCSIWNAKELGAKEIEIVAPYHLIVGANNKDSQAFKRIAQDVDNINTITKKAGLTVKYILDQNFVVVSDDIRTRLYRILSGSKVSSISTGSGFFDDNVNHSDAIIKMRTLKNKTSSAIKCFVPDCDVSDFASYVKAGADVIGLDWKIAPSIVHGYENLVENL